MATAGVGTVNWCPGCGYPVLGPQACAVCLPLLAAGQAQPVEALAGSALPGPIVAA
jgi:hypothetical protein